MPYPRVEGLGRAVVVVEMLRQWAAGAPAAHRPGEQGMAHYGSYKWQCSLPCVKGLGRVVVGWWGALGVGPTAADARGSTSLSVVDNHWLCLQQPW